MNLSNPHNIDADARIKHIQKADVATIYYYDNIVVIEAKEGVTLSYQTAFSALVSGLKYVKNKPFVYISNRVNSYSVNPRDYVLLEKIPTLVAVAIVSPNELGKKNATLELKFFNKPMEIFDTLTDAYQWGIKLLE